MRWPRKSPDTLFAVNTEGMELVVPISVADRASTEVVADDCDNTSTFFVHADITTWVTPA